MVSTEQPHAGWVANNPSTTHTCPEVNGLLAGPGVGLWWTPAPGTSGPYRGVGASSNANTNRVLPATTGVRTSWTNRAAIPSARLPAAPTGV